MKTPSPRTLNRVVAVCVPILLFLTLVAWAYASTVGSSPDDDFHLASIWCGIGLREGLCEDSGDPATRLVPAALLDANCYAHRPEISGACWNPAAEGLGETRREFDTGPLYPPLFYAVMSVFAGPDIQTSVLLMRIANAALGGGSALAGDVLHAPAVLTARRARPDTGRCRTARPIRDGFDQSIVLGAHLRRPGLGCACTERCEQQDDGSSALCVLTVVGAVIGAGARADAAAFAGFGVVLAFLLGARRGRGLLYPAILRGSRSRASPSLSTCRRARAARPSQAWEFSGPPLTMADHISNLLGDSRTVDRRLRRATGLGWFDTILPRFSYPSWRSVLSAQQRSSA